MNILIGKEICRDLDQALQREWLETNGIGGFAASTVIGLNTRRYTVCWYRLPICPQAEWWPFPGLKKPCRYL